MVIRGMNLPLIIACAAIILALIIFPLVISYKAEKKSELKNDNKSDPPKTEWDKIKEYGKQINKKTKDSE